MPKKIKKGEIFKFGFEKKVYGYGQVVEVFKGYITVIIFKKLYNEQDEYSISEISKDDILFFHNTFNTFFNLKRWIVIDRNLEILQNIKLPNYIIETTTGAWVIDFYGNKIRIANLNDKNNIAYKGFVAPINFENAFYDFHKIQNSIDKYDFLFYNKVLASLN